MEIDVEKVKGVAEDILKHCEAMGFTLKKLSVTFRSYNTKNKLVAIQVTHMNWPSSVEDLVPDYILKSTPTRQHEVNLLVFYKRVLNYTRRVFAGAGGIPFLVALSKLSVSNKEDMSSMYELYMYMLMPYTLYTEARTPADYKRILTNHKQSAQILIVWLKMKNKADLLKYAKEFKKNKEAMMLLSIYRRTMRRVFHG